MCSTSFKSLPFLMFIFAFLYLPYLYLYLLFSLNIGLPNKACWRIKPHSLSLGVLCCKMWNVKSRITSNPLQNSGRILSNIFSTLTHLMPVMSSYRNQSIDLLANQLTCFHMRATLALNGLNIKIWNSVEMPLSSKKF